MKLTPLQIRKQEFSKSLRGFNPEEVRAFLETIADQFEKLQHSSSEYSEKVVHLEARLSDYLNMEKTLQETMIKAEESAERGRVDSRREAEITVREAEIEARRIVNEATNQADHLKSEILMLQARRDAFIKKLKYLLQSQADLIEILEGKTTLITEKPTGKINEDDSPAPE